MAEPKKKAQPAARKPAGKKKAPAGIYEKIFNVQQGVKTVMKGGKHEGSHYAYAREVDVVAEIKPLLGEQRLVVTGHTIARSRNEKLVSRTVQFTITNVDNPKEQIVSEWDGDGEDKSGSVVGTPISYTMALKYFLAKTFLIETGDDSERDTTMPGKGKKKDESPEVLFEKAKRMIEGTKNIDGLIEYSENLKSSKTFNAAQKKELQDLISRKIDGPAQG